VLTLMRIKEVIETDFSQVKAEDTLGDLVKVIANSKRNIFPVVDDEGYLSGIVAMDDIRDIIFKPELYHETIVEEIMTMPPAQISLSDTMEKVMETFSETSAWNLPVLDEGKYAGFISKSKMLSVYRSQLIRFSQED
jgi:chloride channel protein, CIC family